MKTEILKIDTNRIEPDKFALIKAVLKEDGVMAFPTDTFYGLGVNCFSEDAIRKVYQLKRRDLSKPLSVFIADKSELEEFVEDIPPIFESLSNEFWPGLLTMVFRASGKLPGILLGHSRLIGVRYPDSDWLRALVRYAGFPITATSANFSDKEDASDPLSVREDFSGKIDLIVDGGRTPGFRPSTVIDISTGIVKILREGALPVSLFRKYLD
ncbi:MAG: L-threonylcarbamoyladenylate synthase [Candidatus Aminicenantes bacterium]|nr:L-threonylcarbamoyladenylate synthase [Candidatus Aminicenantes bacterium]